MKLPFIRSTPETPPNTGSDDASVPAADLQPDVYYFDPRNIARHRAEAAKLGVTLPESPSDPDFPAAIEAIREKDKPLAASIQASVSDKGKDRLNAFLNQGQKQAARAEAPSAVFDKVFKKKNAQGVTVTNKAAVLGAGALGLVAILALANLSPLSNKKTVGAVPGTTPRGGVVSSGGPGAALSGTAPVDATSTLSGTSPVGTVITPLPAPTASDATRAAMTPTNPAATDAKPPSTGSSATQGAGTAYAGTSSTAAYPGTSYATPTTAYAPQPAYTAQEATPLPVASARSVSRPPTVSMPNGPSGAGTAAGAAETGAARTVAGAGPLTLTPAAPRPTGMLAGQAASRTAPAPVTAALIGRAAGSQGQPGAGQQASQPGAAGSAQPGAQVGQAAPAGTAPAAEANAPALFVHASAGQGTANRPGFVVVHADAKPGAAGQLGAAQTGAGAANPAASAPTGYDQVYGNAQGGQPAQPGTPAAQAATSAAAAASAAAQDPALAAYHTGQKLSAHLVTGVSSVAGGTSLPVYAQSDDGTLWRGTASATPEKRLNIIFDLARLPSGKEIALQGGAYDINTFIPGLTANTRNYAPTFAQDLINNTLNGVKQFATASLATTSTVTANNVTVSNQARPDFFTVLAGSAASTFNIPNPQGSFVSLMELPVGSPLLLIVGQVTQGSGKP